MLEETLKKSEDLLKRLEKINKFNSKYAVYPSQEANKVLSEIKIILGSLPAIEQPSNQDELVQSELKRRLDGESKLLDQMLNSKYYDFDTVISIYQIPKEDLQNLKPWLLANKAKTLNAIERLYKVKDVNSYELGLPVDIPAVRRQADEFAAVHIQKYHKRLGKR